jgi:hypothetical protein
VDKREKIGIFHKHLANENVGSLFFRIVINMELVPCMSTFNPRLFTNHDRLKSIAPTHLISLFKPWSDYLANRGIVLSDSSGVEFPFESLSRVLMMPTDDAPPDMVDALYFVHETASDHGLDELLAIAAEHKVLVDHDATSTVADIAVQVWLRDPALLKDRHAESIAFNHKSFMYFAAQDGTPRTFPDASPEQIEQIQDALNDWFYSHKRGRGCRVFVFRREHRVWVLIRHGLPMRREGGHQDDGQTTTQFYRPQQHDVLVYDEQQDEIGIHASTKGERELYLETFGAVLFGNEDYFPFDKEFSLDPLIKDGPAALNCEDILGIDKIVLVEFRKSWGGPQKDTEIRKATDIFAAFGDKWAERLAFGKITSAVFKVRFTGAAKERTVTIRQPNIARYERDDDSDLIEKWLCERKFCPVVSEETEDEAGTFPSVASA